MNIFNGLKAFFKNCYELVLEIEKLPKKTFHAEFYEENTRSYRRPNCSNKVSVEDLRPSKTVDVDESA